MDILSKINEKKAYHQYQIDMWSKRIRDHSFSPFALTNRENDELNDMRINEVYHRGAWNALNELEREIK